MTPLEIKRELAELQAEKKRDKVILQDAKKLSWLEWEKKYNPETFEN